MQHWCPLSVIALKWWDSVMIAVPVKATFADSEQILALTQMHALEPSTLY